MPKGAIEASSPLDVAHPCCHVRLFHTNYRSHRWCKRSHSLLGVTLTQTPPFALLHNCEQPFSLLCKHNVCLP